MVERTDRTIRPHDDEEWKQALGEQGAGANTQQPVQPASPLEQTVAAGSTGSQSVSLPSKAVAAYPLQLRLDLQNYLYEFLKGRDDLPQNDIIRGMAASVKTAWNPVAFVHAKLLADNHGPEAFYIANLSKAQPKSGAGVISINYKFVSEFGTSLGIPIGSARSYITALCGPGALETGAAAELATASLDEVIDVPSLPILLPHLGELSLAASLPHKITVQMPFNSPYFIIMEMSVPTRLLAARALATAYGSGVLTAPSQQTFPTNMYTSIEGFDSNEKRNVMGFCSEIPLEILQSEAAKLSLPQLAATMCSRAYYTTREVLRGRLK